jgi:hypothetical protein
MSTPRGLQLTHQGQPVPSRAHAGVGLADAFADGRDAALEVIAPHEQWVEPLTPSDIRTSAGEAAVAISCGGWFSSARRVALIRRTGRVVRSTRVSRNAVLREEWAGAA